jgi:hypothetical protein
MLVGSWVRQNEESAVVRRPRQMKRVLYVTQRKDTKIEGRGKNEV